MKTSFSFVHSVFLLHFAHGKVSQIRILLCNSRQARQLLPTVISVKQRDEIQPTLL